MLWRFLGLYRTGAVAVAVVATAVGGQDAGSSSSQAPPMPPSPNTILGLSANNAIMILVLLSFVVLAGLLFVLHQQCVRVRRRERRLSIIRRQRDSEGPESGMGEYYSPDDEIALAKLDKPSEDNDSETSGNVALLGISHIKSPPADELVLAEMSTTRAHVVVIDTTEAEEEGVDEKSQRVSSAKVSAWLQTSVDAPPPPGSPQFLSLRASSFVSAATHATSADPTQLDRTSYSEQVYVRKNSTMLPPISSSAALGIALPLARQRSVTLPVTTSTALADPFAEIPTVRLERSHKTEPKLARKVTEGSNVPTQLRHVVQPPVRRKGNGSSRSSDSDPFS